MAALLNPPAAPAAPARTPRRRRGRWLGAGAAALLAATLGGFAWGMHQQPSIAPIDWLLHPVDSFTYALGGNPHPVALHLPQNAPLSAVAQLGKQLFFDTALSASGQQSCASCHDPATGYGPPSSSGPVMRGGPALRTPGFRAPPSLAYLYRQQNFSIGPDNETNENSTLTQMVLAAQGAARATKTAATTAQSAQNLVPQGGLFWDGRCLLYTSPSPRD